MRPIAKPLLACAFDAEGTCVNLEEPNFRALVDAMRELGYCTTVTEIQSLPNAIGGGELHIAAMLSERSGVSPERIIEASNRHFDSLVRDLQITPRLGVVEVIERVKTMGYPIAIGSLTARARGERILKQSGLEAFFRSEHVVFREDVKQLKPAPDVYLETARRMGIPPSAQLVFEDSVPGVRAAVAAGSGTVIAVPVPIFQEEKHINALWDAGAHHICMGWSEVGELLLGSILK